MALFMVQNHLTEQDVLERGHAMDFPGSVVEMFSGDLGQPYGGFPERITKDYFKRERAINSKTR